MNKNLFFQAFVSQLISSIPLTRNLEKLSEEFEIDEENNKSELLPFLKPIKKNKNA